jgi:transcriptional regulator NrdR family protein
MQTQLKIIKADGSVEEYLHTKVIGTINNALGRIDEPDIYMAEQFAEVVTYYLYHQQNCRSVTSREIFSIVKAVLTTTGYEDAAAALSEHYYERMLKRSRIEVVEIDIRELDDAELFVRNGEFDGSCRWDKSRIINHLVTKHELCRQTARMVASMVEEKIFNMGITRVPASLIKQLVLGDAATVLQAQQQLQTA